MSGVFGAGGICPFPQLLRETVRDNVVAAERKSWRVLSK